MCFCFRHKNPKIPQKMLTNYHPGGNIYRQSMDCKTEYGRVPEWPMGTDCKSAAFSFGGSNPPAPTKKPQRMQVRGGFCFATRLNLSGGWIRTAAATALKTAQKQPSGLFLAARLAISTRAHQKTSTYASTLRFLFCDKAKLIGRVDSNSCGDVVEDGAKTAPMDRQVHRGCCYTIILLTLTFS